MVYIMNYLFEQTNDKSKDLRSDQGSEYKIIRLASETAKNKSENKDLGRISQNWRKKGSIQIQAER